MPNSRLENAQKEIHASTEDILKHLTDLVAHAGEDTAEGRQISRLTHELHMLLQSPDFHVFVENAGIKANYRLQYVLEKLKFEATSTKESPARGALLTPNFVSTLDHLNAVVSDLIDTFMFPNTNVTDRIRANIVGLSSAISAYVEESLEDPTPGRPRRSELSEADLLRAQLETSKTELEIREERTKAAELRASRLASLVNHLKSAVGELETKVSGYEDTEATLNELISSARVQKAEVQKIRDEVQTLAADAADNVMAANYGALAKDHARMERFFRWSALLLFTISTTGAALIAWNVGWFGTQETSGSQIEMWIEMAKKLLVAGGLAGIGLYLSRLSSHHRKIEVWSSSLGVQLKTLESYLGGIKDENLKDSIREKFAGLTFGGPPQLDSLTGNSADAKAISEISSALASALRS